MHIDWGAVGSWASFAATLIIGAFVYGRLTERVANHDTRIFKLESTSEDHDRDIVRIKEHLKLK
jgi:hypothetical protein